MKDGQMLETAVIMLPFLQPRFAVLKTITETKRDPHSDQTSVILIPANVIRDTRPQFSDGDRLWCAHVRPSAQ